MDKNQIERFKLTAKFSCVCLFFLAVAGGVGCFLGWLITDVNKTLGWSAVILVLFGHVIYGAYKIAGSAVQHKKP